MPPYTNERPGILYKSCSWGRFAPSPCNCPCMRGSLLAPDLTWTPLAAASSWCANASSCCTQREAAVSLGVGREGGAGRDSRFSQSEAEGKGWRGWDGRRGLTGDVPFGCPKWLAATEGHSQPCGWAGLPWEKTVRDPGDRGGAASFPNPGRSPIKVVTLSLLEPSEAWIIRGRLSSFPLPLLLGLRPAFLEPPVTGFPPPPKEMDWLVSMLEQPFGSKARGASAWPVSTSQACIPPSPQDTVNSSVGETRLSAYDSRS